MITASQIEQGPQYSIQISDWKTGVDVVAEDYSYVNKTDAKMVELKDLADVDELPDHLSIGGNK